MTEFGAELVLPLVVRIERDAPPARTDALEAAAQAVLIMLTTDVAEWVPAVRAWDGQRIRKVVRRARGAAWRRAVDVPGVSITNGSAQIRVYPPVPVDAWPAELVTLQVGGTQLEDPDPPAPPDPTLPLVLLSPVAEMSTGKAMAQAGHAAQLGWRASAAAERALWQAQGFALAVRTASTAAWTRALDLGLPVVRDGGFTEVAPNTQTAAVLLPWRAR